MEKKNMCHATKCRYEFRASVAPDKINQNKIYYVR